MNLITLCDGHGVDFVTVTGQILVFITPRTPRTRPALRRHHVTPNPRPAPKRHTPAAHRPHTGRPAARPCVLGTYGANIQRLLPLAWPDDSRPNRSAERFLTPTTRGRGQEAAAQDGTHPGKT